MTIGNTAGFHDQVIEILREVAAAIILPRYKRLTDGDVRTKTHAGDLVTIADEEAEALLTKRLSPLVPGSRIVGEEGVAKDRSVMQLLDGNDPVWVIDPIDGTANFVNGIDRFAMMIALVRGGETVMGWIHDPLTEATLFAERGAGTWHMSRGATLEPRKIHPSTADLSNMVVAIHHKDLGPYLGRFANNMRLGSAAHDYWALAEERAQILSYRRLKPWDHAAGILIHGEAGGYGRLLTGRSYRPTGSEQEGLICAPTAEAWEKVLNLAWPKTPS